MKISLVLALTAFGISTVSAGLYRADEHGEEDREFMLFPDGDGKLHLIHLKSNEPEPFFNVETGVHFNLYTRSNPTNAQRIRLNDVTALRNSNYNPNHPTRFFCHGWQSSPVNTAIPRAYFSNGDFNVFIIDWSAGSNTINYPAAKNRVVRVGRFVGQFIEFLVVATGARVDDFHLAGHSLGAHVVGNAGRAVAPRKINTIIGTDPALPLFSVSRPNERIDVSSGKYVEIIHTNGGLLGFSSPLGHADFYPNGGRSQPGCGLDIGGACAHNRAASFFIESITSNRGFWSWNCRSYSELMNGTCYVINSLKKMGTPEGLQSNAGIASGIFYLRTLGSSPFAAGRPSGWDNVIRV